METQKEDMKIVFTINSNVISLTSIAITLIGVLWNVFFGYGKLSGRVDAIQEDITEIKISIFRLNDRMEKGFEKLDNKMDQGFEKMDIKMNGLQDDFHKIDLRVNTIEQRKP